MVKKSLRRGGRTRDTKSSKKWKKRAAHYGGKRQQDVFGNEDVEKNWDRKKTLRQNYINLGLMVDPNADLQARGPKNKQSLATNAPDATLTKELERIQALPPKEAYIVKSMSLKEQRLMARLIEKYGDDVEKMARDFKINVHQKTSGELRRRLELYNRLQATTE